MIIFLLLLLSFIVIAMLITWLTNYHEGKNESGCHAQISFELFEKMYHRFPEKWILHHNYCEFLYETTRMDVESRAYKTNTKVFKGYFDLIDIIKYWMFCHDVEVRERETREEKNYDDVIHEFERLERLVEDGKL